MWSLNLRLPTLLSRSSAASASNNRLNNCSSYYSFSRVSFPRKLSACKGKLILRAQSFDNSKESNNYNYNGEDSLLFKGALNKSRREILLEYVQNVQPEFMELFVKRGSPQVIDAMRQTVMSMIGALPLQFFAVTMTVVAENLAQLMYSVLMTGYMFRNVKYRIELQQSLEQVALPGAPASKDAPEFASGSQKKVTGEVIIWNNISGPEKLDAVKYMELLEAKIEELNCQIDRNFSHEQNELLDYLKTLEPHNLKELSGTAGEDVILAMNTFIKRLLAVSEPSQMKTTVTETSARELAKLLYWLMMVGYSIRNIEVRFDMERILGIPPKIAELPPGENI
ncbi:hypothetical protein ACH5RR_027573 [Cinchona calisaya]|uniref:Uncharacterized protein n=1 Tax=Cinchona calisaya TaxID=153742 RepID=A0ABD2Z7P7_9GENT